MPAQSSASLKSFRKKFDAIDKSLLKTLAKRMRLSSKIGAFKRKKGLAFRDTAREKRLIADRKKTARKLGLSPAFAEKIFRETLKESLKVQKRKNRGKK